MASGQRIISVIVDIASQILRGLSSTSAKNPSASRQAGSSRAVFTPDAAPRRTATTTPAHASELQARAARLEGEASPGQLGETATFEVDPPAAGALRISYEPAKDGDADAGEIVWTWVPYEERDGRGKDRPVLVIGRADATHVYVVRLTSKSHDGERDFLSIGTGEWDAQGRESWVDIDQLYLVHNTGLRREAAVLDRTRFLRVAEALQKRYGWGA